MELQKSGLVGKVALITGGTRGISYGVAQRLASHGCALLITCSTPASLTHVASLQRDINGIFSADTGNARPSIIGIVADIYKHDCAGKIADSLSESFDNRVAIVIFNAAAAYATFLAQLDAKQVSESLVASIQTNTFVADELVKRRVFQRDNRIIFLSSVRDHIPWKGQLMYAAGKAAGESMCCTWAEAFGGKHGESDFMYGSTANAVLVGLTSTDAVDNMPEEFVQMSKGEFIPRQDVPRYGEQGEQMGYWADDQR